MKSTPIMHEMNKLIERLFLQGLPPPWTFLLLIRMAQQAQTVIWKKTLLSLKINWKSASSTVFKKMIGYHKFLYFLYYVRDIEKWRNGPGCLKKKLNSFIVHSDRNFISKPRYFWECSRMLINLRYETKLFWKPV